MKIQDVMTRDPSCVTPDSPARDAARIMKEEDVGIVPVVDDQSSRKLVGVVTDRDLAIRIVAAERDGAMRVGEVMSKSGLATCSPDEDIDKAMDAMAAEQVRRIPIVDERGSLVGIVSQADVVLKVGHDDKVERTVEQISEPGGRHQS